jgi:hypothetical protein
MAKQAVSSLERHVEKAVLGVCGLVLLAAIALFLVASPNKKELGAETATPATVYNVVATQAERLSRSIADATREDPPPVRSDVDVLRQWMQNLLAAARLDRMLPPPLPPLPAVPQVGPQGPASDKIELARLLPPTQVKVATSGRTLAVMEPPFILGGQSDTALGTSDFEIAFNWVTVSGVFERSAQERLFREAGYHAGRRDAYVVGVDLQRRERRWDGTYTEWQDITSYAPIMAASPPAIQVIDSGLIKAVSEDDQALVAYFADLIRDPQTQLDLMRPLFPVPIAGDYWKLPQYPDLDIVVLDEEYHLLAGVPADNRYLDVLEEPTETVGQPDPREELERDIRRLESQQERGYLTLADAQAAEDEIKALLNQTGLSTTQNRRLEELLIRTREDVKRLQASPQPQVPVVVQSPQQVVWAHDALRNSVVSGKTYQYRMRLRLYNRYCAFPSPLADPADAEKVVLATDWSEPTEPVTIKLDTEFFLASVSGERVRTDVFKWVEGNWLRQTFDVEPGEPIGGIRRVTLPGEDAVKELVDFDTGAIVLEMDLQRMFRPVRTGSDGWSVGAPKSTVAVVYVDAAGDVRERLLELDRNSDGYRDFRQLARQATAKRPPPSRTPPTAPPTGIGGPGGPPRGGGGRGGGGRGGGL